MNLKRILLVSFLSAISPSHTLGQESSLPNLGEPSQDSASNDQSEWPLGKPDLVPLRHQDGRIAGQNFSTCNDMGNMRVSGTFNFVIDRMQARNAVEEAAEDFYAAIPDFENRFAQAIAMVVAISQVQDIVNRDRTLNDAYFMRNLNTILSTLEPTDKKRHISIAPSIRINNVSTGRKSGCSVQYKKTNL